MVGHGTLNPGMKVRLLLPQPPIFNEHEGATIKIERPERSEGLSIKMVYKVYILECADKTLYTGSTKLLGRRVLEHNLSVRGAKYTSRKRPVRLVYYETYATLKEALRREYEIKHWSRSKKLDLIRNNKTKK